MTLTSRYMKQKNMKQKSTSHGGSDTSHTRPQNTQSHNHFSFKILPSSPPSTQIHNSFGCPLSCVKKDSHNLVRKHFPPNTESCSQFSSKKIPPTQSFQYYTALPHHAVHQTPRAIVIVSRSHVHFGFKTPFTQSTKTHKSHRATVYKPARSDHHKPWLRGDEQE